MRSAAINYTTTSYLIDLSQTQSSNDTVVLKFKLTFKVWNTSGKNFVICNFSSGMCNTRYITHEEKPLIRMCEVTKSKSLVLESIN